MGYDVLVVDDDPKTASLIKLYLARDRYSVRVAHDGQAALALAREKRPGLVILDLMLPHIDGLDVCHILRAESDVPIIMLTARVGEDDKLVGLDSGADDYVTKPFSPRELLARVRAVLRRVGEDPGGPSQLAAGDLIVDLVRREVRVAGRSVHTTPREFAVITELARTPGRAFTRLQLLERAFGYDFDGLERTLDAHVANLRKRIEPDPARPRYILTVQGVGYKLAEDAHAGNSQP
jgi:DNA-binding response OmpR family regulator